jgi:predicted PurR-regulated permease PerM
MKYSELETSTQIILKVIFAFIVLAFLWAVKDIVAILLLALILASAMDPLADYLSLKKIPRVVSVLLVYLVVLGSAALVISLIIPPLIEQYQVLKLNLPEYIFTVQDKLGISFSISGFWTEILNSLGGGNSIITSTFGFFNGFFSFVAVLVISFYLVAEEKGMKNFVAALLPQKHQESVVGLLEKIQKKMGLWILGQLGASVSVFLFAFVGLTLLKVEYALFLALLVGLFEVMPYIGPILSALPAIFFAFLQEPVLAGAVAVLYTLIHFLEGYIVVPKIMQKAVGTSPLLVLFALMVGFKLAGVIGLLIAVPFSTALTVVVQEFWPEAKLP